ncbi:hypothetical protein [Phenylobacterium sp.]|uniref:hypothetical protein n=1 Tax=Phenylobacterium sp. TaxID=1871053 RepID=UPI00374D1775
MIAVVFAAAVVLAQAAPAAAPNASAPPASTPHGVSGVTVTGDKPKKRVVDPTEVICHKEAVLGSLFPKQVCAQRQEFAQRTREDQKDVRDSVLYNPLIIEGR